MYLPTYLPILVTVLGNLNNTGIVTNAETRSATSRTMPAWCAQAWESVNLLHILRRVRLPYNTRFMRVQS